jgi:hypothetical protein
MRPAGALIATLREIMGSLPQQVAGLGQIRHRDLIAFFVVVPPASKETFIRVLHIRVPTHHITGRWCLIGGGVAGNMPIEFCEESHRIETVGTASPLEQGFAQRKECFRGFDVWGDLKAGTYIDKDGEVMSQAPHDQLERCCVREKKALKNQVVEVVAKLGSPDVLLAHAAVQGLQSSQLHNKVVSF